MTSTQSTESTSSGFSVFHSGCPSRLVLEHVTSRWGVLALGALQERTYRFAELCRRLDGVSEKMLAQTLRTLERDGLVLRTSYQQVPPRVDYRLTERGQEVANLVTALVEWVEARTPQIVARDFPRSG